MFMKFDYTDANANLASGQSCQLLVKQLARCQWDTTTGKTIPRKFWGLFDESGKPEFFYKRSISAKLGNILKFFQALESYIEHSTNDKEEKLIFLNLDLNQDFRKLSYQYPGLEVFLTACQVLAQPSKSSEQIMVKFLDGWLRN